jgi:hypothetical protein
MAEAEYTANEIMAHSGHGTMKELVRYTKATDQARLARNAMARTAKREREFANCEMPIMKLDAKCGGA